MKVPASKKRQHYIPRFLLNRFCSRCEPEKKKYWVWQFSKERPPIEISTKDAAVANVFYGSTDLGLEDQLADMEGRTARVLTAIEAGEAPETYRNELRLSVFTQAMRHQAIREIFSSFFPIF